MYRFILVGDEAEHEPSNEHMVSEGGHLSQLERSLITELLEYRKLEADRRKEELQVRREEIALQTRKLEQQTKQWEQEKADREARLALEKEERQLVIALLRKVLLPNGTGWFDCFFSKWHTYFFTFKIFTEPFGKYIPQYSCVSVPLFLANHFVQRNLQSTWLCIILYTASLFFFHKTL